MKERILPLTLSAAFLLLGSFVLDLPGIQSDEALFASVLNNPNIPPVSNVRLMGMRFPSMSFPYIGTLKTAIYALVWCIVEPSPATVHFPVLVIGAISVYLFARILQLLRLPPFAAIFLATDAVFLMTIRSDWGPVALQHLLAIAGVYAVVRFAQTQRMRWVAAAGFAFGLGVWDKITFIFILIALTAGALATARNLLKPKPLALGFLFFLAGCYPFLVYNYKTGGKSFNDRALLDTGPVFEKVRMLWQCLGNENLFAVGSPRALPPVATASYFAAIDYTFPLFPWLVAAALLALPWLWRNPVYRFSLTAAIAGFGAMFALQNLGSGPHHIILLWPLPHLLSGALPLRKWMIAAVVIANLFQINHFYAQFLRREVAVEWSDAIAALAALAARLKYDTRPYRILDWGIYDSIHLLNRGGTRLFVGPWAGERHIGRVPQLSISPIDPGPSVRLIPEETIADSAGRPVFILYRSEPVERK
ncbi:MAG: glycosyltransferase family 39 protein [Acidobacteria bacterium]|nr:glycosyltransferase family 39 protein [Acidobacteriota bacterium]